MSALAIFDPLAEIVDSEYVPSCRFCGCTEDAACWVRVVSDVEGTVRLARDTEEEEEGFWCSWYLPSVCNAPACIEKLIAESRVLLFAPDGRKLA